MADQHSYRAIQTIGHETSVNIVQKQSYVFPYHAGQKRHHGAFVADAHISALPRQDLAYRDYLPPRSISAKVKGAIPEPSWRQPHTSSIRVAGFFDGSRSTLKLADIDIAICTIEKANALDNSAIDEGNIDQLGAVIVDEFHMIDDESRGYLIELMITKLLCVSNGLDKVQIIGMSATLSDVQLIAAWMNAKFYVSKHRPVPVHEYLVYEGGIYPTVDSKEFFRTASQLNSPIATQKPHASRLIDKSIHKELENPMTNAVVALAIETLNAGYGVLVFCSSRQGSQAMAQMIAKAVPTEGITNQMLDARLEFLAALQALPGGFESALKETVVKGVAFHHAGLTTEERETIAEAYDRGVLKVMVATCSLAAGCNLPARRVILNGARMGRDLVGPAMLRQMRGRAGRKGKGEVGESFVCCQKADLEAVAELMEAELPPVTSCLTPDKRGLTRALLEVVATRLAMTPQSIEDYVIRSLLYQLMEPNNVLSTLRTTIRDLLEQNLVEVTETGSYQATRLGQAIVASSLSPDDGIFVHDDLQRALKCFVMDSELHIFYLFTPVQSSTMPDISWTVFRDEMESLDESGMRTLQAVGINPALVHRLAQGTVLKEDTPEQVNRGRIYRRIFSAFQLRDLCNEIPIHEISVRYQVPRGFVQNLAQTCQGFAAGMIKFSERMGWGMLAAVLEHMVDRLRAGARADLLEMATVPFVKSRMARVFYDNGLKSVHALSEADPKDLVPIMMEVQGRKPGRFRGEAAEMLKAKLLIRAETIVSSASRIWERQRFLELHE
ncbi:putative dna-directed dna polymerase theta [Phaeomoniella chlamydospora]|uniref:Putative dna-directed dna polymerase theta n=1 Tax=Phaeomoniella chlamydospora TaxID=158046 RepID=A0A0G2G3K4_PHACM|nr:putative dna-directed dna polymerase theta [Phaeomoniella chlamydospora]